MGLREAAECMATALRASPGNIKVTAMVRASRDRDGTYPIVQYNYYNPFERRYETFRIDIKKFRPNGGYEYSVDQAVGTIGIGEGLIATRRLQAQWETECGVRGFEVQH
jgi:hypothetical protein